LSDDSLFREVDEEVRQEQYKKIWDRYGNHIIAICIVVVVGVAGFKGWQYWQVKQSEEAGQAYFGALKTATGGKVDEGIQQLGAISHAGYKGLAELRAAALLATQGKTAEAVAAFEAVAATTSADPTLRDLAAIRAGYLQADTLSPEDLQAKLSRFDVEGSPWRNAVREITGLAAWRTKNYMLADKTMNAIVADPEAPADLRQRAQTLIGLLAPLLPATP
jgi:hypothetical protein